MNSSALSTSDTTFQRELSNLMEAAGDFVFRLSSQGEILYASKRTYASLKASEPLVGSMLALQVMEDDHDALRIALKVALERQEPSRVDLRIICHLATLWVELQVSVCERISADGSALEKPELFAVGRDISGHHATEERLRHMATHDALTELPNRLLLSDRIRMTIAQSRRNTQGFSVAMLDLDGFKKVNDALGHLVGDKLLQVATARLRKCLRESDTLARVGGDEFVAVLPGTVTEAEIKLVSSRLIATLQSPFDVDGNTIYVGASVGVAVYPDHGDDEVKLLAHADTAMYRAKETGKARCVIYSPQHSNAPDHDLSLEAAMFQAVREGEFLLYYQPIVDAQTRQIRGFETLMRWMHPSQGMIPPIRFIPIAENNGLINLLGAWALKAACFQLKIFEEVAKRRLYVSVNVSPRQFRNDQFLKVLDDALALSGLPGDQLLLEITEGTLMLDPEHAEAVLTKMTARNARIAIDDFGTGYSSLAYLTRFPISALKIDRAFVQNLPDNKKDAAICNAVLDMAKHLDMAVVAEGVETEQQLQFMTERGCQYIQGYLTGKPMPPHIAMEALKPTHTALMATALRPGAK